MKILFYSDKCKHSNNLLNILADKDLLKDIKLVSHEKHKFPPLITKVPTYITNEINHPLIGKEIFEFFDILDFFDKPTNNINYWKDKIIRRPTVDTFDNARNAKEQPMKYLLDYENLIKNKNNNSSKTQNVDKFNNFVNNRKQY